MHDAVSIIVAGGIVVLLLAIVSLVRQRSARRRSAEPGFRMRHWKDDDGDA